ncbi:MAG: 50S ribosomal protein L23 [bacterium]
MAVIEEKKELVSKAKSVVAKATKKVSAPKKEVIAVAKNAEVAYRVLIEPWITEKTHKAIADNKYTFKVVKSSTKKQVKLAIEGTYGVAVSKITVVNIKPKKKAYGRHMGVKSGFKKATVTLKEGSKIELFQAV